MLLRSFCLLCSLLDILIHHIWVHFLKSALLQTPPLLGNTSWRDGETKLVLVHSLTTDKQFSVDAGAKCQTI